MRRTGVAHEGRMIAGKSYSEANGDRIAIASSRVASQLYKTPPDTIPGNFGRGSATTLYSDVYLNVDLLARNSVKC